MEHGLHGRRTVRWKKGKGVQRDGRLQPRGTGHGRRPELSCQKGSGDLGPFGRRDRSAKDHTVRQRPRVHLEDLGRVVQKKKSRT